MQLARDLAAQISADLSITVGAQKWLQGSPADGLPDSLPVSFDNKFTQ
jgi:hypothetical protein